MTYEQIINKYCDDAPALKNLLLRHCGDVARKSLSIAAAHPELKADTQFLFEAAMLHDIGVVKTNAPSIHCFGSEPYIRHGVLGAELLRAEGLPRHARVCERHTGAGLSCAEIERQNLPLPHIDLLPETIEEKIVCYADKFFSKSHPEREKTLAQAECSVAKHGEDGLQRFLCWKKMFE